MCKKTGMFTVRWCTAAQTIFSIAKHHRPVYQGGGVPWACKGCDPGSYPMDNAEWPCSTTELIAEFYNMDLDEFVEFSKDKLDVSVDNSN